MPTRDASDLTPRERVWQIVWWLAKGEKLQPKIIRLTTLLSSRGVRKLMLKMSWVLPIYKEGGKWQAVRDKNEEDDDGQNIQSGGA